MYLTNEIEALKIIIKQIWITCLKVVILCWDHKFSFLNNLQAAFLKKVSVSKYDLYYIMISKKRCHFEVIILNLLLSLLTRILLI